MIMIAIHDGNVVYLVPRTTRIADIIQGGKRLVWRRS